MHGVDEIYARLEDEGYFTGEELELCTSGWGYSLETLDLMCQVRYSEDADQLLGLEDEEEEDEEDDEF